MDYRAPRDATVDVTAPRRQVGILVFDGVEELDAVGRFMDVERAREVRRYLQYDPMPPVAALSVRARSA